MIYCKEIEEYLTWCRENPDCIDQDIKLLIKNIVLPTLKRTDIYFDSENYYNFLKYTKKWYYEFFPYQKFIHAFVFFYEQSTNEPLFKVFITYMGRGNGKDAMYAPLIDYLGTQYYGIKNYNIDIVANSEEQSNDTYNLVYDTMESNKNIMKKYFYWNKEERISKITKSRLRYNTANAKTKDGKKNGAILFNEYHAYLDYAQINVFEGSLGKVSHARIFIITTDGDVRDGPLDELLNVCNAILNGEENNLRYFPAIYRLDDAEEVNDPAKWIKANPSIDYLPALKEIIKTQFLDMQKYPSKRAGFMTKRMNIPIRSEDQTVTSWENILKASFKDLQNKVVRDCPDLSSKKCIIGIDFASLRDFATVGFLFKIKNEYIWKHKTWICKRSPFFNDIKFPFENAGQPGFEDFIVVDAESINEDDLIEYAMNEGSKYNVQKIVLDTYRFKLIKQAFLNRGLTIEEKNNPNGLIRMIRYPASIAAIIAPRIEIEFAEGNINIGNSSMMRWAINNTKVIQKGDGNKSYEKIEPKLRKNDPFMAFIAAMSTSELLDEKVVYV